MMGQDRNRTDTLAHTNSLELTANITGDEGTTAFVERAGFEKKTNTHMRMPLTLKIQL